MTKRNPISNPWLPFFRRTLGPLLLVALCPPFAILLWHTHVRLDGSVTALLRLLWDEGPLQAIAAIWGPVFFGSKTAWLMLAGYALFEIALLRWLPGKRFLGPVTPAGDVPEYKANGVAAFAVTLGLFAACSFGLHLFPATVIYDRFGELLGALNLFSLLACLGLCVKGRVAPSSADSGTSGNPVFDYYWGTELFPRVLGLNFKMFTNCRFAMMGWPLVIISFAAKQHDLFGLSDGMMVAVGLQLVYIAKFFVWETGYLGSLDIMHDRAGFYISWGVLVWLPSVYTSQTLYLVHHPRALGPIASAAIGAIGLAAILVNYLADAERQRVRATAGRTTVWGKEPVLIRAPYATARGEAKESLLLASGFWGIARHFHYLPEILAAIAWTLPVLFDDLLPWFYVTFLTVLLFHRAFRDDARCAAKYGAAWDEYRRRVPRRIIPGLV